MTFVVPAEYGGREQALVKHELLKSYLEKLVLIIGMSAKRSGKVEICYVDCFAGPWGARGEDLDGTSISLSLSLLAVTKLALEKQGVKSRMRALYVEKGKQAFARLSTYLRERAPSSVEHDCRNGDFLDLQAEILDWCGPDAFTFFFVDPKGWKEIGPKKMEPLLRRPRSEFLINFAFNNINRTVSMDAWQDDMKELLGATVELEDMLPADREEALVNAYRTALTRRVPAKHSKYRARTAYVTVLDPLQQRTKYHLVYLTTHPLGIVKFMEISEHVDAVQKKVRAATRFDARSKETGMLDMFGPSPDAAEGARENGRLPVDVDNYWRTYLADGERLIDTDAFAEILEQTNWLPSELQASLVRLLKAGELRNLDANATTRYKRPLHFEANERLQLIKV
ncbi:three-Cys-motif partner protein TcmP [Paraburkholderia azotifigens]|uniref:Three-Cys-motif partner protein TcmP n=1 Tax=Paraburkholderia azotifigens TaxID=2057004 RepID=A0A5C6V7L5_9BURK|nr:three-Cys-motif partner protein TcmP [Paraburkholderia azotifigens]TXC81039.1 three-Cys-motif partner protein TcmP [Paraburkholderia azotifigens]